MWPTHRSGGRRIRLHGLHGRSTRTTRSCGPRSAYLAGSEGPNIATTGVPTAPARCIGPVSPVTNTSRRSRIAARVGRSASPETSMTRQSRSEDLRIATSAASSGLPVSTIVAPYAFARRRATSPNLSGSHCLIARPPLTCTPTSGSDRLLGRRLAASRLADSGIVRVDPERPIARRPKTAATSARALSLVCARGSYSMARSSRPPPPPAAYPAANEAPLAARSRLLRMSGSKLIARSYRRWRQDSA